MLFALDTDKRLSGPQKTVGGRAHLRLVDALPTSGARLQAVARDLGDLHLPRHDPHHGQALGIKHDPPKLLKPLLKLRPTTALDFFQQTLSIFICKSIYKLLIDTPKSSSWSSKCFDKPLTLKRP